MAECALWSTACPRALLRHRRDLLALKIAQDLYLALGDQVNLRDVAARLLPAWPEDTPEPASCSGCMPAAWRNAATAGQDWGPSFFAVHNWWHSGLYHLELGQLRHALAIYDRVATQGLATPLGRVDAASLLWRLWLHGADIGGRANALADAFEATLSGSAHQYPSAVELLGQARRHASVFGGRNNGTQHSGAACRRRTTSTVSLRHAGSSAE